MKSDLREKTDTEEVRQMSKKSIAILAAVLMLTAAVFGPIHAAAEGESGSIPGGIGSELGGPVGEGIPINIPEKAAEGGLETIPVPETEKPVVKDFPEGGKSGETSLRGIKPKLELEKDTVEGVMGKNIGTIVILMTSDVDFAASIPDGAIRISPAPSGLDYMVSGGGGSTATLIITGTPTVAGTVSSTLTADPQAFADTESEGASLPFSWRILDVYPVEYRNGTQVVWDEKVEGRKLILKDEGTFSETGKYLDGWAKTENAASKDYGLGDEYTVNAPLVLYPFWRDPMTFSIRYHNGSITIEDTKTEDVPKTIRGKDTFSEAGKSLKGWTETEGSSIIDYAFGDSYKVNHDLDLYPVWGAPGTNTIKYSYGSTTITQTKTEGESIMLLGEGTFTRGGFALTGWAETPDSATAEYDLGETYSKDENLDLYPVWKENVATYTVLYINGSETKQQTKVSGTDLQLLDGSAFTKTGEKLAGWTTTQGSATVQYSLGQMYMVDAPLTLYPVWTVIHVTGITLSPSSYTFTKLGDMIHLNASVIPPDAKVTAIGWSSSDSSVATVDGNGNVTARKKGTAVITAETYEGHYRATCQIRVEPAEPVLHWSFQKDTDHIGYKEYVILHLYVENRQSDTVVLHRGSSRIYIQGAGGSYVKKTHTNEYEVTLEANGYADVFVMPQYNGSVTLTAQAKGTEKKSRTFTITGYPTMPQTGPDYTMIDVTTGLSAAALAAAGALSMIRKKREQQV